MINCPKWQPTLAAKKKTSLIWIWGIRENRWNKHSVARHNTIFKKNHYYNVTSGCLVIFLYLYALFTSYRAKSPSRHIKTVNISGSFVLPISCFCFFLCLLDFSSWVSYNSQPFTDTINMFHPVWRVSALINRTRPSRFERIHPLWITSWPPSAVHPGDLMSYSVFEHLP